MAYAFENQRRKAVREAATRNAPNPSTILVRIDDDTSEFKTVFYMQDGTTHTVSAAGYDGEVDCTTEPAA